MEVTILNKSSQVYIQTTAMVYDVEWMMLLAMTGMAQPMRSLPSLSILQTWTPKHK